MRPVAKVLIVAGGYAAALAVAAAVVALYVATTSGPDRQQSAGMFAFGDSLLFLAVFAAAAVPATVAALVFLRPYRAVWIALQAGAIAIAATGIAALLAYLFQSSGAAVLRILVAPAFALLFLLSGVVAPRRSARIVFFATTAAEVIAFACVAFLWLHPPH